MGARCCERAATRETLGQAEKEPGLIRYVSPALLVLVLAGPALATSTVYSDRATWEAAVTGSIYTETFDSVPDQSTDRDLGGTIHTPGFDIVIPPGGSIRTAGGFFYGDLEPAYANFNELVFATPITAFGVDLVSVEDSLPISLTIAGETFSYIPVSPVPGYGQPSLPGFFGMVSDTPFTSVRLLAASPRFYTADNVSHAVPEPSLALVGLVAALCFSRHSRLRCERALRHERRGAWRRACQ
jgi:hypothetical protein